MTGSAHPIPVATPATSGAEEQAVSGGYVALAARLLASPEVAAGAGQPLDAATEPAVPIELPGKDGTLLAVVPVPGTGTSLVIVGYSVPTSDTRQVLAPGTEAGLVIDRLQRRVQADGQEIDLTFQEFELLAFLSEHPGTVFSRADLGTQVWQASFGADSRTVDVHVSRLRRKLGPVYGCCIATEYRAGYRFHPPGVPLTAPSALPGEPAPGPDGS